MKIIRSLGQTLRRSFARSRPFCPGRTTSVSSSRTMLLYSLNADVASGCASRFQHPIARGLQNLASYLAQEGFIFHQQDSSVAPGWIGVGYDRDRVGDHLRGWLRMIHVVCPPGTKTYRQPHLHREHSPRETREAYTPLRVTAMEIVRTDLREPIGHGMNGRLGKNA